MVTISVSFRAAGACREVAEKEMKDLITVARKVTGNAS